MINRRIYAVLLTLLSPAILLFTLWRAWRRPLYRERWRERFGWGVPHQDHPIWIHAVSVGETIAAIPLVHALQARYPGVPILMTTTTPTGSAIVAQRLGSAVRQHYMPYDLPSAVKRFLVRQQPRLGLIMETEIWPNLCHAASRAAVPLLLVNARLSPRSLRGYGRFPYLFQPALARMAAIAAQSSEDAVAFQSLGAEQITVTGNLKYDLPDPVDARAKGLLWRERLGMRPIWVFASTHAGEEEMALTVLEQLQVQWSDVLLVLIPRHPSRRAEVQARLQARHMHCALRSKTEDCRERSVLLVDTLGEVMDFYAVANMVTIGGSFVPSGGHNPLEAAALSCPISFGPHMENFRAISHDMLAADAAVQVADGEALKNQLQQWLIHPEAVAEMGQKAFRLVQEQRGALQKILHLVEVVERQTHDHSDASGR
ncbi:MAG: lipid IV(A) 3-deoxy-D-manno-octulosonic acid transferase [Acidithiobacillus sp.]